MPAFHFIHPGDLATRTGGYRYARELLAALARRGVVATVHRLADSFPFPDAPALAEADRVLRSIADGSLVVVDGLALGAMPAQAAVHAGRLKLVALVHHPLALESGLSADDAARLAASERAALATVRAVVVTSPATAKALLDYEVPPGRVTVVLPGTDRVAPATAVPSAFPPAPAPAPAPEPAPAAGPAIAPPVAPPVSVGEPVRLLCVASVTPRKGHGDLVEALAACRARRPDLAWQLVCVGSLDRDPACAVALRDRIAAAGLGDRVCLAGERDEAGVDRAYGTADVFVLASYHEGYGMVLAEAIAHGLPVVSTTAGAIPDTVPAGAGLLVMSGDVAALSQALEQVIGGGAVRAEMAACARQAAAGLPDWETAAQRFSGVLQSLSDREEASDPLSFSAAWLALREPHDHAARADDLTEQLRRYLHVRTRAEAGGTIKVLDLACGSGSSLRHLAPRLGGRQHWTMVDRDRALLALLPSTCPPQATIEPLCLDLAGRLDELPLEAVDLVTASALLDLVSAPWLERLVARVVAAVRQGSAATPALLFALSYDGSTTWQPALPDDGWALALFNRHQRGDKGFGPALGPDAAAEAALRLAASGFRVTQATSPWRLGTRDAAIQRELLTGMAGAAAECVVTASERDRVQAWMRERTDLIGAGRSGVEVGHRDLLALPPTSALSLPGR